MPVRQNFDVSHPGWLADGASEQRDPTVSAPDWDRVPASYENDAGVKVIPSGAVISRAAGGLAMPRAALAAEITSLTESGGTATATTTAAHPYAVGDTVTIEGSDNYDGDHVVTAVPSATTFEFEIAGSPVDETDTYDSFVPAHGLLIGPAIEDDKDHALGGYGVVVGGVVFENLLPDFGNEDFATFKAELHAAAPGLRFVTYADDRVPE